jgi:PAS domain S-box-containing protein
MVLVTVLVSFCIFAAFVTTALGFTILAINPRSTPHRLFFLVMLAATYWAFGEYSFWMADTYEWALFWLKASSFWPVVPAATLHFILVLTDNRLLKGSRSWVVLSIIYTPAILFAFTGIGTSLIRTVVFVPGIGYVYQVVGDSLVYVAESAYILLIMGTALLVSARSWLRSGEGKIRRQYLLVSAGIAIIIAFGFQSGILLPRYGIYLPNMVFIGIVLFSVIITYTIIRYELFNLNPGTVAPDIVRILPDGLILGTMEGNIVMANSRAATICNAREEELPGRKIGECIGDPVISTIIPTLMEKGTFSDMEVLHDGETGIVLSISGALVRDPRGDPAGVILILRDITRRKESEHALRLANEKISLMTRLTRHDIANLVTGLWGYLELLKVSPAGSDKEGFLDKSLELVEKINDQLRFTREFQDIGLYKPDWQPLRMLFAKAVTNLPTGSIAILQKIDDVEVYADQLTSNVLYNILENAARHGGDITKIDISTREIDSGDLLVVITDDGIGIPYEDKEKIFAHGYGSHTGIGLALSREILSITGITIREDGVPGEGGRFEIRVPGRAWRKSGNSG